ARGMRISAYFVRGAAHGENIRIEKGIQGKKRWGGAQRDKLRRSRARSKRWFYHLSEVTCDFGRLLRARLLVTRRSLRGRRFRLLRARLFLTRRSIRRIAEAVANAADGLDAVAG